ncbi:MAG TPA: hypothetical protein VFA10_07645 [Ktedonobacteraceae bacterium]|nr:hypothetical protein [Ktedonobacteraceae bacterium]
MTAYELDPTLAAYLPETLGLCQQLCESAGIVLTGEIRHEVISPHGPQSCIRIVSDEGDQQIAKRMATLPATLEDLGIEVSTGRVVDFRVEALLRLHPEEGTVPLLYPTHISSGEVVWPSQEARKPGALLALTRAVISSFPMNPTSS